MSNINIPPPHHHLLQKYSDINNSRKQLFNIVIFLHTEQHQAEEM